mmetsp:Transcript_73915/g.209341  ORF Transcript_73915/g.209341 Transcript_73915/m.209341 type:complete len:264 (-) Transcript_73915:396-1187(-)
MRLEARTRVEGNDRRRGLLSSKPVIVARVGHGAPHKVVVLLEAVGKACDSSDEELACRVGLPWVEEIKAGVRAHGPVVVLAGAVDSRKGLLVKEHNEANLCGLLGGDLHEEDIVVRGECGLAVDWRHLMLGRCDLVVDDGHGHPEHEHLCLDVEEQLRHAVGHGREVVEVRLLVSGRQCPHQRPAAVDQVRPRFVVLGLDDEELLLPAQEGVDGLGVSADLDGLEQTQALPVDSVIGTEQRGLVINAGAQVRDKAARNPQHIV